MPMIRLFIFCLLVLSACSGTRYVAPNPDFQARADSLLAIPVDSLSSADQAWLGAYSARRQEAERIPERDRTVFTVLGVLFFLGVAGAVWALQSSSSN